MKKTLLSLLFAAFGLSLFSQYIPNAGFENWDTIFLYSEPTLWNSGNYQTAGTDVIPVIRTEDSYSGQYALQMLSGTYQSYVVFGYVFCNGMLADDENIDTIKYSGGFPMTASPDSLHGYFKYNIAAGDTAIGLVSFKKDGKVIAQNMIQFYGIKNNYVKMSFEMQDMIEAPDTAMIAFACTNAFINPVAGNTLNVDSLWFTGTTDTIPNADFENWDDLSYIDPTDWASFNEIISFSSMEPYSSTPTTDAHSGNLALRLESVKIPNMNQPGDTMTAAILIQQPGGGSLNGNMPPFLININPTSFTGYYKLISAGDTAGVQIVLTDIDNLDYSFYAWLLPTNSYTRFEIPMTYPLGTVIRELRITFTTNYREGIYGTLGNVLYLDDLSLVNPCEGVPELTIQNISTQKECLPQKLDAGEDWDKYEWSTGEDTQIIDAQFYHIDYSVTVTNYSTGCYLMDTIKINAAICDKIEDNTVNINSISIYPIPAKEQINIDFANMMPGEYNAEIITITGSIVKKLSVSINQSNTIKTMNVNDLKEGLYLLKITGDKFSKTEKIKIQ